METEQNSDYRIVNFLESLRLAPSAGVAFAELLCIADNRRAGVLKLVDFATAASTKRSTALVPKYSKQANALTS